MTEDSVWTSGSEDDDPAAGGVAVSSWAASMWTLAGIGVGQLYAGRYVAAGVWFGVRLVGPAVFIALAMLLPSLALPLLLLSALWGWLLLLPAGWHAARSVGRRTASPGVAVTIGCAVLGLGLVFAGSWLTRAFVAQPFSIPTTSMEPMLADGDHILAGTGFLRSAPAHGQVVVLRYPRDRDVLYVRRVVGLPGDTIAFRGNKLVRNGKVVTGARLGPHAYDDMCEPESAHLYDESSYRVLMHDLPSPLATMQERVVPPGEVFVVGDNRDRSGDSRSPSWVGVPVDDIIGTARVITFSFDPCDGSLRWDRIGTAL